MPRLGEQVGWSDDLRLNHLTILGENLKDNEKFKHEDLRV